jgi:hypothetical protein
VLTNLVEVSGNEYLRNRNSQEGRDIYTFLTENSDKRFCHLNPFNNKVLAEIVYDSFEPRGTYINLGRDSRFSYDSNELRYLLDIQ